MYDVVVAEKTPILKPFTLTEDEKKILKKIRDKKLFYILSSYFALTGILLFAIIESWGKSYRYGEDEVSRFKAIAPYFYSFLFIILTAYFGNYYFKLVHPFVKDVKKGLKEVIFFQPEKFQTPFFEEYYLVTPIKGKPRIKINKELFEAIQIETTAFVSLALYSRFMFSIDINGRKMEFNDSNVRIDI